MMPFSKAYSLSFGTESIVGVTEFDENKTAVSFLNFS
jgi:hypothetical protein